MTLLMQAHRENDFETTGRRIAKWSTRTVGTAFHRFCPGETWSPSINFYEDDEQYSIIVDLAGVDGNAIDIRVDPKGMMVLSGSRQAPQAPCQGGQVRLHLMEIDHGAFCRTLELPDDAKIDAIEASYRTGFLRVRIPKKKRRAKR